MSTFERTLYDRFNKTIFFKAIEGNFNEEKNMIRDLIYVSGNTEDKIFYSYGIEFREFMNSYQDKPESLVLLKDNFDNATFCAIIP
jgi:hypothetical protein